jgi:tRNA(adenine34) deaminase
MEAALHQASKAAAIDEVPIGAVIVKDGRIIAHGYNRREHTCDPTSHAEINAIRQATRKLKSWRLLGCTMYVTIEPCSMCAGAILWSRIDTVVFGADDPKGGALGSSYNLYEQKNLNHYPRVISGIKKDACQSIITEYFKNKRNAK